MDFLVNANKRSRYRNLFLLHGDRAVVLTQAPMQAHMHPPKPGAAQMEIEWTLQGTCYERRDEVVSEEPL